MENIKGTTLNIKQIQEIIPHRYPFLFVDKVEELEPGKRAVGYKNITMNEYFFQGHFPTEPVLPGVIIIFLQARLMSAPADTARLFIKATVGTELSRIASLI